MHTSFALSVRSEGTASVVFLSGEVDMDAEQKLGELGRLAAVSSSNAVVVDLSELAFIDSTGLNAVVRIRDAAADAGKSFALRNIPPRTEQLLKLCGLEFLEG